MIQSREKLIQGFSKLSKEEKLAWLTKNFTLSESFAADVLAQYWLADTEAQSKFDEISENTISNFLLPYGIAPNFLIDGKVYAVPMVIEVSSVVAAASMAGKYWSDRGGFVTEIVDTEKVGQVHFLWKKDVAELQAEFDLLKGKLLDAAKPLTQNMENRGGGVKRIELKVREDITKGLCQLHCTFETCDSMGANFINTVLEDFAKSLTDIYDDTVEIIMSILSNYTPQCLVRATVSCPIDSLGSVNGMSGEKFAEKFKTAIDIAKADIYRATTHNKGFFNGVDAIALATGNDFRAIEACGHAYCARNGSYSSISDCSIDKGIFKFWVDLPIALGTVGGLTKLHPLANLSLEILDRPSSKTLMSIFACVGLAQNFAAVRSLVTTGIQKGHMKMHLTNILNELHANGAEVLHATSYFSDKVISFSSVRNYLESLRNQTVS